MAEITKEKKKKKVDGRSNKPKSPKQILFLKYYLDPKEKETFGNARRSAIKAEFTEEYADNIMNLMPKWLSDSIGKRQVLLAKAERNLAATLDIDENEQAIGAFGPLVDKATKEPIMRRNAKVLAIKHDASKFVAETLGKKHYSKRHELTGQDGDAVKIEYHIPKKSKPEDWNGNPSILPPEKT